jgi:glutathione S-transferase
MVVLGMTDMARAEIVLHQWEVSPFCAKVRHILEHKSISYRVKNYHGIHAPLAAWLTPAGKLPVLDINGERLQDSRVIALYLEQNFPLAPLIPQRDDERALMEIWQDWADESLYWYNFYFRLEYDDSWRKVARHFAEGRPAYEELIVRLFGRSKYRRQLRGQGLGRQSREAVNARFQLLINALDTHLREREFIVGRNKTLADIAVGSHLREMLRTSNHAGVAIENSLEISRWLRSV